MGEFALKSVRMLAICFAWLGCLAYSAQAAAEPVVAVTQAQTVDPDELPTDETPDRIAALTAECDADDAKACTRLAYFYHEGDDVPQDDVRATALFARISLRSGL